MICRTLPLLATTFALALAAAPADAVAPKQKRSEPAPAREPAREFSRPDSEDLLRQAKELWLIKQDLPGALLKFNAAVDADPTDSDARLARAHFLEVLSHFVNPADKPKFEELSKADFEQIVDSDPESLVAGVARDGLTRLAGEPLLEAKAVACPAHADDAHARGNMLYGSYRFTEAVAEYARATAGCPESAAWWVDLADSFYEMDDYEKAKTNFFKALAVDRWNREAHRFLSDTLVQLGENHEAVHHLALSVVSDPTYEAGWSALRGYGTTMGFKWNRVYGDRRPVPENADAAGWAAYAAAKSKPREGADAPASALAIERDAVRAALKTSSGETGPFWSMMARADTAGFLDEAIFLHLLDAPLATEYPAFREQKAERLASYLETVILR